MELFFLSLQNVSNIQDICLFSCFSLSCLPLEAYKEKSVSFFSVLFCHLLQAVNAREFRFFFKLLKLIRSIRF